MSEHWTDMLARHSREQAEEMRQIDNAEQMAIAGVLVIFGVVLICLAVFA